MNHMEILMSIKKEFSNAIFAGLKTVELRKSKPIPDFPCRVFVYESRGCGMVVGEFVCYDVERWEIPAIWYLYGHRIGVTRHELDAYYGCCDFGYTWLIMDAIRYEAPRPLSEFGVCRPPLSWSYLRGDSELSAS